MLKSMLTSLLLISLNAASAQAACVLTTNGNVPFQPSHQQPDSEYSTIEKGTANGVTFYLRAAHGVIRLEAWKSGKMLANTFVQAGNYPPYGDALTLDVATAKGETEAQCEGINAAASR